MASAVVSKKSQLKYVNLGSSKAEVLHIRHLEEKFVVVVTSADVDPQHACIMPLRDPRVLVELDPA
jgi:hypothetical protein